MIDKQKKQIGLGIFITLLMLIFLAFIIEDNAATNVSTGETTVNPTTVTPETVSGQNLPSTIGVETTGFSGEEETTTKISIRKIRKKHKDKLPFKIRVNRAENFVTVYTLNDDGKYTVPYKTFWCSTGKAVDSTPLGRFEMTERYDWRIMVDGTYAQYAIRIHGPIMLHSVPYITSSHDSLEYWEYNKLGKPASLGCIRLQAGDIQWIYEHCESGTKVVIYDKENEQPPIRLPKLKKIKKDNPNRDWDPSDTNKDNPWNKSEKSN